MDPVIHSMVFEKNFLVTFDMLSQVFNSDHMDGQKRLTEYCQYIYQTGGGDDIRVTYTISSHTTAPNGMKMVSITNVWADDMQRIMYGPYGPSSEPSSIIIKSVRKSGIPFYKIRSNQHLRNYLIKSDDDIKILQAKPYITVDTDITYRNKIRRYNQQKVVQESQNSVQIVSQP